MRVAAVQLAVGTDVEANLQTSLRLVDEAVAQGAELVVLPEFGNHVSWYDGREHARSKAVTLDGAYVEALAHKAKEHAIWLMANCTVAQPDGRTTGTNLLLSPDGSLVASSDKQVLMGSERDHLDPAVSAGPVVETPFGRVGLYSCMDGVINETPRGLAVRGAQLLLNSLNSFALDEASLHVPVRAAENKVWVVAANKVGPLIPDDRIDAVSQLVGVPVEMLHGAGESQVVAPDGTVVARGPRTGEAVVIADIDVSVADDKRRPDGTDVMAARRPEIYAPLAAEPRGRVAPAGAEELRVAVVQTRDWQPEVVAAVAAGAQLVVLPELVGDAAELSALLGTGAHAVMSAAVDGAHVGLLVSGAGVVGEQLQLHASARHAAWQTRLGDGVRVFELPWGRLAVLVGDDTVFPESFRLAALQDADVVACPMTVLEPWELATGLVERGAENRVNVVAASLPGPAGASVVVRLSPDFTLWSSWSKPFDGCISLPEVDRVDPVETSHLALVRPACATNRFVSRGTDVVDGRPWQLLDALTH